MGLQSPSTFVAGWAKLSEKKGHKIEKKIGGTKRGVGKGGIVGRVGKRRYSTRFHSRSGKTPRAWGR